MNITKSESRSTEPNSNRITRLDIVLDQLIDYLLGTTKMDDIAVVSDLPCGTIDLAQCIGSQQKQVYPPENNKK